MDLKDIKVGMVVSIRLTSGAEVSGVIAVKNTIEFKDSDAVVFRIQITEKQSVDISEDDIECIKYIENKENAVDMQMSAICRNFEKYGIEEGMKIREILNYFIYTWNDNSYSDEDKEDICRKLSFLFDSEMIYELFDLIVECSGQLEKYHNQCKRYLNREIERLAYKLDKDFESWNTMPLLDPER